MENTKPRTLYFTGFVKMTKLKKAWIKPSKPWVARSSRAGCTKKIAGSGESLNPFLVLSGASGGALAEKREEKRGKYRKYRRG